jgi:hypothetical protein
MTSMNSSRLDATWYKILMLECSKYSIEATCDIRNCIFPFGHLSFGIEHSFRPPVLNTNLGNASLSSSTEDSADWYCHEIVSGETAGPRRARPSRRALFFSRLEYGGNRSPEPFGLELMAERPVEGNAEGARLPRKQVAEKTSP